MRNLCLLLFLLTTQFASAQSYLPIVHPANEWTVKHYEFFSNSRRKYRFSPDTVLINGKYYYELKYDDSVMGAHSTNRFYREENGTVYTSAGVVLYDLKLGVTDTLPSNNPYQQTRTVATVGTTILNDNQTRKTMRVECGSDSIDSPITVVEGIGDLEEFFHSEVQCINPFDGPTDLLVCYSVNGQIIYTKSGENCDLSSTHLPSNWTRASVYPNPANEQLHLDIPSNTAELIIYNSLGMCVLNQHCTAVGGLLSADVSGLRPGSYWGVVRSEYGKMYTFVFLSGKN
jgi:hypothetical protein